MKAQVASTNIQKATVDEDLISSSKPPNPMLTYKAIDSPSTSNGSSNQPAFAIKVAEQLRNCQEQIEGDVYGLDSKSPIRKES